MKRVFALLLGVALAATFGATMASAANKYPPGPAYRSCPDSVTIFSVQQTDTLLAPCHPALLDTVLGVKGLVSGFDARGGAYAVYFQNGTGPWTGVQAFTGATNYITFGSGLAIGDSIAVYGTTQEFPATNGTTEIEGPDATQSTNDIIIRKINSGNSVFARTVTVAQMNWLTAFNPTAEQYEGLLVKINGPLKVGRIAGTGIQSPNLLLTCATCGTDSVLIDQFTLDPSAPASPLPVGTTIESVTGIVNQNTSSAGTGSISSYRIQTRNGNDIVSATPPSLSDAYPIEDNQIRLVFDKNLDQTTAETESNYSLASGIDGSIINNATMPSVPGNIVILTITSVLADGDLETVSAGGIGSATCPTCLISPQQNRTFVNGVLKCADVQRPDPTQLSLFNDRSRFAGTGTLPGTKFTVRGTAVKQYGVLYYIVDEDGGNRGGMSIFAPSSPLTAGTRYRVAGQVQEFDFESECVNTALITDEGGGSIPDPAIQSVGTFADTTTDMTQSVLTGEDFEGMLVKVVHVRVTETRTVGQSFFVAGQKPSYPDTILVSNLSGALNGVTPPDSAMDCSITGILHYTNGRFRVCPRDADDIKVHGLNVDVGEEFAELSFAVSPNPARSANLTFALPRADRVELGVFDLMGRQVASLARGRLPAGQYTKVWAGTDASGARVHPGMYFYRLKVGSEVRMVRGVLLQ